MTSSNLDDSEHEREEVRQRAMSLFHRKRDHQKSHQNRTSNKLTRENGPNGCSCLIEEKMV